MPGFAYDYHPNSSGRNAVSFGQIGQANAIGDVRLANCQHIRISELGIVVSGASRSVLRILAVLRYHVRYIVLMSATEQMAWSYTSRVIAMMQNLHPIRNGAISHLPRCAMRTHVLTISPSVAVPVWIRTGSPNPARPKLGPVSWHRAILIYFSPKATFKWRHAWMDLVIREKPARLALNRTSFLIRLLAYRGALSAATVAKTIGNFFRGYARMFLHLKSPIQIWGATLPAVSAARGLLAALYYSTLVREGIA